MYKYSNDDYCDIYENKICDNCGKCLELEGVDIRAIKIEDIAKTSEENKVLEEEFLNDLKSNLNEDELKEIESQNLSLMDVYNKFKQNSNLSKDFYSENEDDEYEDAFEHIEYLNDDEFNEADIEDLTEEVYPGVRKLKMKIND